MDQNRAYIITARKAPFNEKQIAAQSLKAYYTIVDIN